MAELVNQAYPWTGFPNGTASVYGYAVRPMLIEQALVPYGRDFTSGFAPAMINPTGMPPGLVGIPGVYGGSTGLGRLACDCPGQQGMAGVEGLDGILSFLDAPAPVVGVPVKYVGLAAIAAYYFFGKKRRRR